MSGSTLRDRIERARAAGTPFSLEQAIGLIVPLCVEAAHFHTQGAKFYLNPSNIVDDHHGNYRFSPELSGAAPVLPQDRHCFAPELRPGQVGNAHSTVYAIGAILYELVTLKTTGPGMRRPREIVPNLPSTLDAILGKALVTDPSHRPDDLLALAQAIHALAPPNAILIAPPPPADISHLDHDGDFDVDVSMSLLPPAPAPPPSSAVSRSVVPDSMAQAMNIRIVESKPPRGDQATNQLAALKQRLESDPLPHYVIIKDGIDHGPFTAVELLHLIAANAFVEDDMLRDNSSGKQGAIRGWDEFSPFADHARRHRDIKAEKAAVVRVVAMETKATRGKAIAGIAIVAALLAGAVVWFLTQRRARNDDVALQTDTATNIESEGNLNVPLRQRSRQGGPGGGVSSLGGGLSCEAAQAAYVEEITMNGGQPDITRGQYESIMNTGSYFAHCGVPENVSLNICAAVQNGRAVGVTVTTSPSSPGAAGCVASAVRGLKFPQHPKLDVVRVSFAAQ